MSLGTSQDVIPLFIASDSGCMHGLVVTIESALAASGPGTRFEIHIADCGLDPRVRASMEEAWSADPKVSEVIVHRLSLEMFDGMFTDSRLRPATLARLQMPELMAGRHRVVYLDTDLLVCGDLGEIARLDLDGGSLAGVVDYFPNLGSTNYRLGELPLELDPAEVCVNAGVLVADLDKWREVGIWEKGSLLLREHSDKFYHHDQSVINLLLSGSFRLLDSKWNRQQELLDEVPMLAKSDGIIHFIGKTKPWHYAYRPGCGAVSRWHEQLARTKVALPPLDRPSLGYRGPLGWLYARKAAQLVAMRARTFLDRCRN